MDAEKLPTGWEVWNAESEGRVVLVYRSDVFDSQAFPAPCLPTIRVAPGSPGRRRRRGAERTEGWSASLRLEPEVRVRECDRRTESREAALAAAREVAAAFAAGEVDYRGAYQVPRENYLEELDRLTG
jgi:hypothetical protein